MSEEDLGELGQAVAAHRVLGPPDDPWLGVHEGRLAADEAARRLRGKEPEEVIEQSKAVFERSFAEQDRQRFDEVLGLYRGSAPEPSGVSVLGRWLPWSGLAVAAALLLWWLLPPRPLGTYYEVELRRDLAEFRSLSDRGDVRTYRRDRSLEAWLRPADAVDDAVEVAVYARRDGGTRRLAVEPTIEANGVVHIVAGVESLGLTVGEWELLFVVGRKGTLPGSIEDLPAEAEAGMRRPYEVHSVRVCIIPPEE